MADATIHGIEYQIIGNANNAVSSLDKLATTLKRVKAAAGSGLGLNAIVRDLNNLARTTQTINPMSIVQLANALNSIGKIKISPNIVKGMQDIQRVLSTFSPEQTTMIANMLNGFGKIKTVGTDKFKEGILIFADQLERIASMDLSNLERAGQAMQSFANAFKAMSGSGKSQNEAEKSLTIWQKIKGIAGAGIRGLGTLIAWPPSSSIGRLKDYGNHIDKVVSGFKRIIFYRVIRQAIKAISDGFKEGTKNLYAWSKAMGGALSANGQTFAESLDMISTAMLYFKNSIGAAVSPIISALAPAIDLLMDKIVALLNAVNQLFARLMGASSWNRAIKKTTEYENAVSGTGSAAKEAMKYLAPFDELNRLPGNNGSNGGGGSSAEDASGMFEEVAEFNQAIADFADSLRERINASDWEGLGTLLGTKINDLIEGINFSSIGTKVGTSINALFTTKYWTLETINFQNIGSKIAEFFNSALENINFEIIGRTLTQKFTIIGDLIIGAIRDVNWGQVTASISDLIKGAFDQLSEWLQEIDWLEFGNTFYNQIKNALEGIDFDGIATSVFTFLGTALASAVSGIAGVISDVWEDIKDYFNQYIELYTGDDIGFNIIAGILDGIIAAVANIGKWIYDNVLMPFWNGIKSVFGIHSPSEVMKEPGQMIGEGILEGILQPFKNIGAWIDEHILDPIKEKLKNFSLKNLLFGGGDDSGSGTGSSDFVGSVDVEANVVSARDSIPVAQKISDGWNATVEAAKDGIESAKKTLNGWKVNIAEATDNIKSKVSNAWKAVFGSKDSKAIDGSKINSVANLTSATPGFASGKDYLDGKYPVLTSVARMNQMKVEFAKGKDFVDGKYPVLTTIARMNQTKIDFPTNGKDFASGKFPILSSIARMTATKNELTGDKLPTLPSKANFTTRNNSLTEAQRTFPSKANFTTLSDNIDTTFGSVANFTDWYNNLGYQPEIECTAKILDYETNNPGYVMGGYGYAKGGAYYGGFWHDIPQAAFGGKFHGTMFWAGENGPEIVGHAGSRTEVLNRSQLASTMYAAVHSAMAGARFNVSSIPLASDTYSGEMDEEMIYRAMLRALNDSDNDRPIELDGEIVYRKMVNRNRANTRVTGVNALAG